MVLDLRLLSLRLLSLRLLSLRLLSLRLLSPLRFIGIMYAIFYNLIICLSILTKYSFQFFLNLKK
jgi:hypothetical protein